MQVSVDATAVILARRGTQASRKAAARKRASRDQSVINP